ncbi:small multi-drug resistant family protein [Caldimonas tepidiphila]|uniref:small multi-drug resistant family protein n=1 Tax=Caldimonas tepidiphila TaxID=2315841 RepID=UPI000E5A9ABE|nr:small multi-drug resistant family protein [Caldimonas tepidiphila]
MNGKALMLICASVMLSSLAQVVLKLGMSRPGMRGPFESFAATLWAFGSNPVLLGGMAMYGLGALAWLGVLARMEVSAAYPFAGLGFVVTMALGFLVFGEALTAPRVLGTAMIVAGVVLVARSA